MDRLIQVLAIVVPIVMSIVFGLIVFAFKQTFGRVLDKVNDLTVDLKEHEDLCRVVDKKVLQNDVDTMKKEIDGFRKFSHWANDSLFIIADKMVPGITLPRRSD